MNIYEHFACHTHLPVRLSDVRQHILDTGLVARIIRVPVKLDHYIIQGGYHLIRDRKPYASPGQKIARIAFPATAPLAMQRLVCVKEMLHVLDPHEATAPTKDRVDELIRDLRRQSAGRSIGLPAAFDRIGLLHALCILLPRDALSDLRPAFKSGRITAESVSEAAMLPLAYAELALTDAWVDLVDKIC